VSFYASHPELKFEMERVEAGKLARGSVENWCQLCLGKAAAELIQITCVTEKKELLYGWIAQIYPYNPKIS
jgi:hypothetical protein